jgi:hypothetical protein
VVTNLFTQETLAVADAVSGEDDHETFTFASPPPDAYYEALMLASPNGALTEESISQFFSFAGDLNRDATVDQTDMLMY